MCVSCGCGEPNERHKPGDITMDDLTKAAKNHDLKIEDVAKNISEAASGSKSSGSSSR
jgi:hypothetical protein